MACSSPLTLNEISSVEHGWFEKATYWFSQTFLGCKVNVKPFSLKRAKLNLLLLPSITSCCPLLLQKPLFTTEQERPPEDANENFVNVCTVGTDWCSIRLFWLHAVQLPLSDCMNGWPCVCVSCDWLAPGSGLRSAGIGSSSPATCVRLN